MLRIEGHEPVADVAEEGEALHLREAAKVDVGTLSLHVGHAADALLHALHGLLGGFGVEDVVERVLVHLHQSATRHLQPAATHDVGQDFLLDGVAVGIGLQAVDKLHLQFGQLGCRALVGTEAGHRLPQLGVECVHTSRRSMEHEHPAHEGPLAQRLVGGLTVDLAEHAQFLLAERLHGREHDGTDDELLVDAGQRRREKHVDEGIGQALAPRTGGDDIVEQVAHQPGMLAVEGVAFLLSGVLRLQLEHGHLADEGLHAGPHSRHRPVGACLAGPLMNGFQIGALGEQPA